MRRGVLNKNYSRFKSSLWPIADRTRLSVVANVTFSVTDVHVQVEKMIPKIKLAGEMWFPTRSNETRISGERIDSLESVMACPSLHM